MSHQYKHVSSGQSDPADFPAGVDPFDVIESAWDFEHEYGAERQEEPMIRTNTRRVLSVLGTDYPEIGYNLGLQTTCRQDEDPDTGLTFDEWCQDQAEAHSREMWGEAYERFPHEVIFILDEYGRQHVEVMPQYAYAEGLEWTDAPLFVSDLYWDYYIDITHDDRYVEQEALRQAEERSADMIWGAEIDPDGPPFDVAVAADWDPQSELDEEEIPMFDITFLVDPDPGNCFTRAARYDRVARVMDALDDPDTHAGASVTLDTLVQNAASGSLISYKALLDHFEVDRSQTQNIVAMCELLMQQHNRITELEGQVSQLSNRVAELIQDRHALRTDINHLDDATWNLQQDINHLEWKNRTLRRDLDDAWTDVVTLEEQLAARKNSPLQRVVNWLRGLFHKPQVPDYDDIPF